MATVRPDCRPMKAARWVSWLGVKAQGYFRESPSLERQQKAKSWKLRAAMSLAGCGAVTGSGDEARDLLAPVYGWFTEGFDTAT
jgi:hypothetical protein